MRYDYYEHPAAPTIELARLYWRDDGSKHCKNLFSAIIKATGITSSFSTATEIWRSAISNAGCDRESSRSLPNSGWNGIWDSVRVSVSPFGLINDTENHVHLFLDRNLRQQHS